MQLLIVLSLISAVLSTNWILVDNKCQIYKNQSCTKKDGVVSCGNPNEFICKQPCLNPKTVSKRHCIGPKMVKARTNFAFDIEINSLVSYSSKDRVVSQWKQCIFLNSGNSTQCTMMHATEIPCSQFFSPVVMKPPHHDVIALLPPRCFHPRSQENIDDIIRRGYERQLLMEHASNEVILWETRGRTTLPPSSPTKVKKFPLVPPHKPLPFNFNLYGFPDEKIPEPFQSRLDEMNQRKKEEEKEIVDLMQVV
jgi:hypothetical protein